MTKRIVGKSAGALLGVIALLGFAPSANACIAQFEAANVTCNDNRCHVEVEVDPTGDSTRVQLRGTIHAVRDIRIFTADGDDIERTTMEDIPFNITEDTYDHDDLGGGTWMISFSVDVPDAAAKTIGRELGRLDALGDGARSTGGYLEFDSMGYVSCRTLR